MDVWATEATLNQLPKPVCLHLRMTRVELWFAGVELKSWYKSRDEMFASLLGFSIEEI